MNRSVRPGRGNDGKSGGDIVDNEVWGRLMESSKPETGNDQEVDNDSRQCNEEEIAEGIEPIVKREMLSSRDEVRRCTANHIPFRSWCEHCVKGRSGSNRRMMRKQDQSGEVTAIVSIDHMFMGDISRKVRKGVYR